MMGVVRRVLAWWRRAPPSPMTEEEKKSLVPQEIRDASHDMTNSVMKQGRNIHRANKVMDQVDDRMSVFLRRQREREVNGHG